MTWEMIHLKFSALKQSRWYEYLVRFVLGGLVTCLAGLVADIGGPSLGGLFLAFSRNLSRERDPHRGA